MKNFAAACRWLAIAVAIVAFFVGDYLHDANVNDFKLACYRSGGHWDMWQSTCVK